MGRVKVFKESVNCKGEIYSSMLVIEAINICWIYGAIGGNEGFTKISEDKSKRIYKKHIDDHSYYKIEVDK